MPVPHHSKKVFTGRMPFLPPIQQRQSTEGKALKAKALNAAEAKTEYEVRVGVVAQW